MVAPDIELVEWRDPVNPSATPVSLSTPRAFFWPREGRLVLPDQLAGKHGQDAFRAASASARLSDGRLALAGPASVEAFVTIAPAAGATKPLAKRVKVAVGAGGQLAYNPRSGGAMLEGGAQLVVPADNLQASCLRAVYAGSETGRADLRGDVRVTSPRGAGSAPAAVIETKAQQVILSGPVRLELGDAAGGANITAPSVVYWYESGRSRAVATGGVLVTSGSTTVRAPRAEVDLEAQRAVLNGGVTLQHLATYDGATHPVTVSGRSLRHTYTAGRRRSEMAGGVRFVLQEARGQAARMAFDHETEQLVLDGGVRIRTRDGETARCPRVTYDSPTDTLTVEAPAEATVQLESGG